jgi:AcrR family transcriptional regulator
VATEIPRTLRVLWGEPATRPGQTLSRDRIVRAGIAIADADGIAALSMARLAERLGSAPMSLYRHVSNKDELLIFMMDTVSEEPPTLPDGWRAGLEAWAHALRGLYYAHPWILQIAAGRPPLEPAQLAWLDRALSVFHPTTLPIRDRMESVLTVLNYVRGEAQIGAILLAGDDPQKTMREYADLLAHFVTRDRFPALNAAVEAGLFTAEDDSFGYGLAQILDGIATRIG